MLDQLLGNSVATLAGAGYGLLLGGLIGLLIGVALGRARRRGERHGAWAGSAFVSLVAIESFPPVALAPAISAAMTTESARVLLATIAVVPAVAAIVASSVMSSLVSRSVTGVRTMAAHLRAPARRTIVVIELKPALSTVLLATQVAVPAALLGSVFAELFGADRGLGVFIMNSLAQGRFPEVWTGCLWVSALGAVPIAIAGLVRWRLRWHETGDPIADVEPGRPVGLPAVAALTAAVVLALWLGLAFGLRETGAIPWPWELRAWADRPAADVRRLVEASLETLGHWVVGVAAGLLAIVALSIVVWVVPYLRQPAAAVLVFLRSAPLVVIVPVVASMFGRGLATVAVAGALTTVLVGLLATLEALEHLPKQLFELARLSRGRRVRVVRCIVLPAVVTALRGPAPVIVPLALSGVVLAEWLATGNGLGTLIVTAQSQYDLVLSWSAALVLLLAAVTSSLLLLTRASRSQRAQ